MPSDAIVELITGTGSAVACGPEEWLAAFEKRV